MPSSSSRSSSAKKVTPAATISAALVPAVARDRPVGDHRHRVGVGLQRRQAAGILDHDVGRGQQPRHLVGPAHRVAEAAALERAAQAPVGAAEDHGEEPPVRGDGGHRLGHVGADTPRARCEQHHPLVGPDAELGPHGRGRQPGRRASR